MRLDYDPIIFLENIKANKNNFTKAILEVAKYQVKSVDYLYHTNIFADLSENVIYLLAEA